MTGGEIKLDINEKELLKEKKLAILEKSKVYECSLVAMFWKDSELYFEKYDIVKKLIKTKIWKFYFKLGNKAVCNGVKVLDEISIYTYLQNFDDLKKEFENFGGYNLIENAIDVVNLKNIDSCIENLKKYSIVFDFINDMTITKDRMEKLLELENAEDISNFFDIKLDKIKTIVQTEDNYKTVGKLNDDLDGVIQRGNEGINVGLPLKKSPILSQEICGLRLGELVLFAGYSGSGKAQKLDAPILTDRGYIPMGEVKIGTKVFGEDGNLHNVVGVYPQGVKDIYEVVFSDGTKVECCKEHLWNVQNPNMRKIGKWKTVDLGNIMNDDLYKIGKYGYKKWQYYIPMTNPLNFKERKVLIDPYILGLLLGDGSLSQSSIKFTNEEQDIIQKLKKILEKDNFEVKQMSNIKDFIITDKEATRLNRLSRCLNTYGLRGHNSYTKFIPEDYLYNTSEVRLKVLQGLIDTDGYTEISGYEFCTTSLQLCEDVKFLVQSLGGTATFSIKDNAKYTYNNDKKDGAIAYKLYIKAPKEMIFHTSEKHNKKYKGGQTQARRTIREINYIGKEECQCIKTDNPTQLYITNDCIVTHNTTFTQEIYLSSMWETEESCVIFLNEQTREKWKQQFLTWIVNNIILKNSNKKFKSKRWREGKFSQEELDWLYKAKEMLEEKINDNSIIIEELNCYISDDVRKAIKKYAKLGIKYFAIDTFKISGDYQNNNATWFNMQEDMRKYADLIKESNLNVNLWVTLQLEKSSITYRYITDSNIGMSKNIVDVADTVILMRNIRNDEYDNGRNKIEVVNPINLDHYKSGNKVELTDETENYNIIFIDKNRNGRSKTFQIVAKNNLGTLEYEEVGITSIPFGT